MQRLGFYFLAQIIPAYRKAVFYKSLHMQPKAFVSEMQLQLKNSFCDKKRDENTNEGGFLTNQVFPNCFYSFI